MPTHKYLKATVTMNKTKMKPILFSTPMVQAILADRKMQTRREMKPQPYKEGMFWQYNKHQSGTSEPSEVGSEPLFIKCPYGKIGDVLWVKEMHYRYGHWIKNGISKTGKQKWLFVPDKQFTEVRYFDNPPAKIEKSSFRGTGWYKRNSLFMPREACRLFLKVTNVRVERLHDISEEDAIAEGIGSGFRMNAGYPDYQHIDKRGICELTQDTAVMSYASLWEKINGKGSWDLNPWVWVIEFKRLIQ